MIHSSLDCRKDSDLIKSFFRGAVLTENERNEFNKMGIFILNAKGIGYSSQFIYGGSSYDELRTVSKFEVNPRVRAGKSMFLNYWKKI